MDTREIRKARGINLGLFFYGLQLLTRGGIYQSTSQVLQTQYNHKKTQTISDRGGSQGLALEECTTCIQPIYHQPKTPPK